ncbi:prolyl oligopeptidase family serine peptidase [Singulisphaera sp. PoT]|uniref:prolyl oligopeptidase family serine peptidase n=1 Tax=Singulisphaera sp. PoT TaxID=3411797 RepID=UPI003BF4B5F7
MSISFRCTRCGKPFHVADELAGKAAKCKQCGQRLTIPARGTTLDEPDDPYDLQEIAQPPRPSKPETGPLPPGPGMGDPRRAGFKPRPEREIGGSESGSGSGKTWVKNVVGGVLIVLFFLRVYGGYRRDLRKAEPANGLAAQPGTPAPLAAGSTVDPNAPIAMPVLPELGSGIEIEPGIQLHEVHLPGGTQPGHSGKIWAYLPSGEHAPRSLPCVMITGAGSNLLTGMELGDGDRPEHLPYVRAGFAVVAYELDGMLRDRENINEAELGACMNKFLAARAGLVNAHVAIEFALSKVPQIDPERIYTAGHSSAGTMSLLFAENEPRLKGCIAFAAPVDLEARFGPEAVQEFKQVGFGDLAIKYSPKYGEAKLQCPVYLFHARDDSNVPVSQSEDCMRRLEQLGKTVVLDIVETGNHYDSMIAEGIPRAIAWLRQEAHVSAEPEQAPISRAASPFQRPGPHIYMPPSSPFRRIRPPLIPSRPRGPRFGPRGFRNR